MTGCEIKIHKVDITRVRKLCCKAQRLRWVAPTAQGRSATATEAQQTTPPPKIAPPLEGGELAGNLATFLPPPELRVTELQPPATATSVSPLDGQRANMHQTSIEVSAVACPRKTPPCAQASEHTWEAKDGRTLPQAEFDDFVRDGIRVRPSFALMAVAEASTYPAPPAIPAEPPNISKGARRRQRTERRMPRWLWRERSHPR